MKKTVQLNNIISIVTPSFNQAEFLEDTIKSVLSQDGDFYIDYIINDGGSSDESVKIIKKYESLLKKNCDVVELSGLKFFERKNKGFELNNCLGISYRWLSEKDKGQSDAINKGVHTAVGDIAAFINSDDVYYPHTLKTIIDVDWSNIDFVYGKGMWISKNGDDLVYYPTFRPGRHSMYYQCTLCQPTVFFKRSTYDQLGDFSLKFHCSFDYEFWLRAIFQNCRFKYVNRLLAASRMYETNKSLSSEQLVRDEISELRDKYYSDPEVRLVRVGMWHKYLTVQLPTVRRVNRLGMLLGDALHDKKSAENSSIKNDDKQINSANALSSRGDVQIEDEPINLTYDISVLGAGTINNLSRTGIFRVAENLLLGLSKNKELNIEVFASNQFLWIARKFVKKEAGMGLQKPSSGIKLEVFQSGQIKIFHSPFYAIPDEINQQKSVSKFLTIYDLIPIKFPEFFTQEAVDQFKGILDSISADTNILCISHSTKNDLCDYLDFIDPDKVHVTHLAASSLFYPVSDNLQIDRIKKKYGIPNSPYILSLSTLEPRKNIETAIQAFLDLVNQEKIADVNLVLVGSKGWKIESVIEKYSNNPALEGRLIFTGFVDDNDLAPLYSGSSAFVYPSFYEGFGLPPLEAMQCGVPVISSDNSSIPEVVGDAGILIDPNDKDALSRSIFRVINSPELRSVLKKKSIRQAKKFSWEKLTEATITAYRSAGASEQVNGSLEKASSLKIGLNFTGLIPGKIGGMEKYMRALVHYIPLISKSHLLYVFLRPETLDEIEESEYVKRVCIEKVPMPDERQSEIHDAVEELGIDIWLSPLLILDPHTLNIPSLFCVPDLQHEYYPEFFSQDVLDWREKYFKKSAEIADGILTISDFSKQTIIDRFGISPEKIHVTWLDCPTYFTLEKAIEHEEYVRQEYELPKEFLFYPANTWAHKNHLTLIKALERYDEIYGNPPSLVLTGYQSDAHTEIAAAIEESNLNGRVQFLGYVSKEFMPAIYKNASCLVFPSMFEGFGIPLVEAMRTNCPIIASNSTTMKEIAGDAAIYFNTMDEIELAVLIRFMMTDQRLRKTLIKNGEKRARLFSFEKCVSQTLRIIEEVDKSNRRSHTETRADNPGSRLSA